MQVILTEEEYNALAGRATLRAADQIKIFRQVLAHKITHCKRLCPGQSFSENAIPLRALTVLMDEAAAEAFK